MSLLSRNFEKEMRNVKEKSYYKSTGINGVTFIQSKSYPVTLQQVLERHRIRTIKHNKKMNYQKNIVEVIATDHALERWNMRVGKTMNSKVQLSLYLSALLSSPIKRYEILEVPKQEDDLYLMQIDNDIIASFTFDNEIIIFCSFFGRISKVPALADWRILRHFNNRRSYSEKYGVIKKKDTVNLDFTPEEMNKEKLPAVPHSIWQFETNTTKYCIEKYFVIEQKEPIYLISQVTSKMADWFIVNTASACEKSLTNRLLNLIYLDGQEAFVKNYVKTRNLMHKQLTKKKSVSF